MGVLDDFGKILGINAPGANTAGLNVTNLNGLGTYSGASALQNSLSGMQQFSPLTAQGSTYQGGPAFKEDAYKAKDMSKQAMPQYDAMRTRLNSQYSQQQSQSQDALDRQFAASGGGPGNGAQMKQTENLSAGIAQQKGQDLLGINSQEAQARQDLQNQENQKEFQSGETQKGYGFQAGQADLGRLFQSGEAAAARNQQTNQFNAQMGQQQNQFNFDANSKIAGLNFDYQKAQADRADTEFNKAMAEYQNKHSGGLLGNGGFLGTGIGA